MRNIRETRLLGIVRNKRIILLEQRRKLLRKNRTRLENFLSLRRHFLFVNIEHGSVRFGICTQNGITLFESTIVFYERIEIKSVILRNNNIHEFPPSLSPTRNKFAVVGRNHYQRNKSYMVGKTFVSLLVQSELLAFMLLHTARNLILLSVFIRIITHSHHIFFVVSHGQSVKHRGCAVAKRHIIYCVKHISFAFAVLANQTIDLGRKFKVGGSNILVINQ